MKDKPKNENDHLEGLLRDWGAGEAARSSEPPESPAPPAPPERDSGPGAASVLLRWAPAALAAGLLVAATWFYVQTMHVETGRESADARPSAVAHEKVVVPSVEGKPTTRTRPAATELQAELAAAEEEARRFGETLESKEMELRSLQEQMKALREMTVPAERHREALEQARSQAEREAEAARREALVEAEKRLEPLRKSLEDREADLAKLRVELGNLKKVLADLTEQRDEALRQKKAAGDALVQQRQRYDRALAEARDEARRELDIQLAIAFANMQRAYLAVAGEGAEGLSARQAAAERSGVLERVVAAQRQDLTAETRRVLARTEVLLTRLSMLNPRIPDEATAFASLVRRSDLPRRLEALLAEGIPAAQTRSLLFEIKLILSGAEHAS